MSGNEDAEIDDVTDKKLPKYVSYDRHDDADEDAYSDDESDELEME